MLKFLQIIKNKMEKTEAKKRLATIENEVKELRKIIESPEKKKSIIERILSYEAACYELGLDPIKELPYTNAKTNRQKVMNAHVMADIIAEAIQEGEICDWLNGNKKKWRPWFEYTTSGFRFSYSAYAYSDSDTFVGSRLCFSSEEKANHFGKHFIEIHRIILETI